MKRALRIVGIVVAVILIIIIALPFVINVNSFRPTIESELSSSLGRQVKIGNLKLSILSGSVAADDLSISDDPAFSRNPFIRAQALKVGVELWPLLFSKALHVTELTLEKPEVTLLRSPSGKWNFSSLGASASKPAETKLPEPAQPATPSASPSSAPSASPTENLSVARLSIKDGRVTLADTNAPGKAHVYQNVDVTVRNFSFASQFPFSLSSDLPGGGDLKLDGTAGPINPNDASLTPLQAKVNVKKLDLAATGFVEPSSGISGLADFEGTVASDGRDLHSSGTANATKLKLSPKGSPAGRPVQVKYGVVHNLQKQAGELTQGDVGMGQASAHLTGSYQMQGNSTIVSMKLNGQGMPVNDLEAMLPALGVVLPSGSSLQGGTLSTALAISGPVDKLVISGLIRLADTKLAGFDMGSKMSAISALSGAKTGSDTTIQNLSTDVHVAPSGIQTQNVNLTIPTLGVLTGNGTVSPEGALDYKMSANLSGSVVTGLTSMVGLGSKGGSIPFFIQGTTANPKFVPDVKGMLGAKFANPLKSGTPGQNSGESIVNSITGLFGKKKQQK